MTHHVLVIDDAATVRMYHRKILGDAGWGTDEATNGVEALERVHDRLQVVRQQDAEGGAGERGAFWMPSVMGGT